MKIRSLLAVLVLVALTIMLPGQVNRSAQAGELGYGVADCAPRVLVGLTFASGLSDPSGGGSFNFPQPCIETTYNGKQFGEFGMIGLGASGVPGDDSSNPNGGRATLGAIACLWKGACIEPLWIFEKDAKDNVGIRGAVDLGATIRAAGDFFGWAASKVPTAVPPEPTPAPAAYLPSFAGLNALTQ